MVVLLGVRWEGGKMADRYSMPSIRGDTMTQTGLMAQDVLKVNPDAVVTMPNGFMAVDYERALA